MSDENFRNDGEVFVNVPHDTIARTAWHVGPAGKTLLSQIVRRYY